MSTTKERKGVTMQQKYDSKAEKPVLTIEEAADMLSISRATAYTLARQGRLPVIRISDRRWIVPRKALEQLLESATSK